MTRFGKVQKSTKIESDYIHEENTSIASLANLAIEEIEVLAKNKKLSHKLAAFNLILFLVVLGLDLSYWVFGWSNDNLMFIGSVIISFLFSAIVTLFYSRGIKLLLRMICHKVTGFRASIPILMTALTFSLFGLLFKSEVFINLSGVLLITQAVVILVFGSFELYNLKVEDKPITQVNPRQWLGDIANIITIINFLASIIIVFIKLLK